MTTSHCENCGAPLNARIALSKVVDCEQCGSTSVRTDEAFHLAGERGVLSEGARLIVLGHDVAVGGYRLTPIGHCQFDYGRGLWDEFWCIDHKGEGFWLSADEGDYALESPIDLPTGIFKLGETRRIEGEDYRAVEVDTAVCTGFRGELPEILELGEEHDYVVFAGDQRNMATLERWRGGFSWTQGRWYSAWDVQPL